MGLLLAASTAAAAAATGSDEEDEDACRNTHIPDLEAAINQFHQRNISITCIYIDLHGNPTYYVNYTFVGLISPCSSCKDCTSAPKGGRSFV